MKPHPKVKVLELKLDRIHFTRHGLHLNFEGKNLVFQKVAQVLQSFFTKSNLTAIPASWKDPSTDVNPIGQDLITNEAINPLLPSSAQHRTVWPAPRNSDFLWQ
jgi:hypothetical protein